MFKIGDIVEITKESDTTGILDFNKGEGYEVIGASSTGSTVRVMDMNGRADWYHCTHFKLKEDTIVEKKECLFKEGQVVWDVVYGKGVVVEIAEYSVYPVVVQFSDETMAYSEDGKTYETHGRTLFFSEPRIEAATEPLFEPTLKKGDKVMVEFEEGMLDACIVKEELEDRILTECGDLIYKHGTEIFRIGEKINFK